MNEIEIERILAEARCGNLSPAEIGRTAIEWLETLHPSDDDDDEMLVAVLKLLGQLVHFV